MSRLLLLLFPLGIGCIADPIANTEATPLRPGAIANRTALVSFTIQDGRAQLDDVRCKPIDFLDHRHEGETGKADHYLEVTGPGHARAIEIPVAIGQRSDPQAEASSAWAGGGAILRAPCFGPGTKIALKRSATQETLAKIEVRE